MHRRSASGCLFRYRLASPPSHQAEIKLASITPSSSRQNVHPRNGTTLECSKSAQTFISRFSLFESRQENIFKYHESLPTLINLSSLSSSTLRSIPCSTLTQTIS